MVFYLCSSYNNFPLPRYKSDQMVERILVHFNLNDLYDNESIPNCNFFKVMELQDVSIPEKVNLQLNKE